MGNSHRYVFCGGGSGGHLYPGISVAQEIKTREPGSQFLFLTTGRDIERRILDDSHLEQFLVDSVTSSALFRKPLTGIPSLIGAVQTIRTRMRELAPDVVIGLGGFGSVPGILAAKSLRIPVVILEQNVIAGRANSLLGQLSRVICTSFPHSREMKLPKARCEWTGNPIRKEILQAVSDANDSNPRRHLLVLGGSQGAHKINRAFRDFCSRHEDLLSNWSVTHQTGKSDQQEFDEFYNTMPLNVTCSDFIDEMDQELSHSSLVITRAGATTLAELAAIGRPAVVIPDPKSIRNHQHLNAVYYAQRGGVALVEEDQGGEEFSSRFHQVLGSLLSDSDKLEEMARQQRESGRPDATQRVADVILSQR
ncbi:UDP-N-acetylglucosamine--N-acetylmuramyl-(pentapeptide) pyrophosphoryl-undecaprenol N-acetylglucosamine transferase MurG [Thalassoglobus neptunius]|uniref:UDP-N-acetylglucosamine--N-acetylmuramyl-(pentapeptide) pyrophosphoryl-undecaprenol N-acetylglucosamine transferase n=1 Tax=Thalassoglobus neptunius TaxID=1938619 RepID=A0A5C5X0L9_9PLAN|nr:UDP-N-acetylglucosamine--N-acetylmuramyl-(pentapeptide) pyrophosphoryl-undecaprenol N-acetylglucosamine transferase [Thalassoglobus neptunius]TWT55752.1 UDP-N-acetylglucosamine--N-acetylmuramyl-(pentapeptide) pyrophosphoryl-undecaprenol N-acetylglucosamine transferase MurG [Thalassoglobus neptunius]